MIYILVPLLPKVPRQMVCFWRPNCSQLLQKTIPQSRGENGDGQKRRRNILKWTTMEIRTDCWWLRRFFLFLLYVPFRFFPFGEKRAEVPPWVVEIEYCNNTIQRPTRRGEIESTLFPIDDVPARNMTTNLLQFCRFSSSLKKKPSISIIPSSAPLSDLLLRCIKIIKRLKRYSGIEYY